MGLIEKFVLLGCKEDGEVCKQFDASYGIKGKQLILHIISAKRLI